ncbi:hypothetical protein VFPPC_10645 [Pochonia chlamydosporia 170]|uniref:DUF7492 domain-containing protein n=1 Tax=Pochonia chlamydosporia 170 TaxID=1380566 RepID=A0A179F479_METCM|nr:hypothetical protein VFPPC_10645 [Pochonia chlamydosporia 170]OAQ60216.1 hypothetical protein VFPPC_10645 [Pochonia chlamydosporia 170]
MRALFSSLIVATFLPCCFAHSWVERLMRINGQGTMVGNPGYARGAISRLAPGFSDLQMQYLLPPDGRVGMPGIYPTDHMCKPSQSIGNYNASLPQLQANPGDYIALQYQENGHVTLPENTPQKNSSGTVYVYGTLYPSNDDTLFSIHKVWNNEGTGGNARGRLLAARPFDDGQCHQINQGNISLQRQTLYAKAAEDPQGADLWCQCDIKLPMDIQDQYTLYWVWDWPSTPTSEFPAGQEEIYTSCMDLAIGDDIQSGKMIYREGQDLNNALCLRISSACISSSSSASCLVYLVPNGMCRGWPALPEDTIVRAHYLVKLRCLGGLFLVGGLMPALRQRKNMTTPLWHGFTDTSVRERMSLD